MPEIIEMNGKRWAVFLVDPNAEPEPSVTFVVAAIRNWHRPVTAGANHYDGGLRRHCSECRHPWPCRTYQLTEPKR